MALEHALLVALREQPAAGLELARRFEKSIGNFWQASHQQIYKTLNRMAAAGWVAATEVSQTDRPTKLVYAVTAAGSELLANWLTEPTPADPLRSNLAVKLRGLSFADDPGPVLSDVRQHLAEHTAKLAEYHRLAAAYDDPQTLTEAELDQYLVLRGGIGLEGFWVDWLTEFLTVKAPEGEAI